jgi:hypothetical protein
LSADFFSGERLKAWSYRLATYLERLPRERQFDVLLHLQVALRAYSLYAGPIDGISGPATRRGIKRFQQRVGRKHGRHKNNGGVGACLLFGLCDRIEDGPAFVRGSALARRDAADNVGAVSRAGLGMERTFTPCNSLDHQPRGFID